MWFNENEGLLQRLGGVLHFDGQDLADLAREFGTPSYVFSATAIRRNARAFSDALDEAWTHGPTRVLASFKACTLLAVRSILDSEGVGADVFGSSELLGVLRAGTDPAMISLNGSFKDADVLRRAIEVGANVTVDSPRELRQLEALASQLGRRVNVRIRLRPMLGSFGVSSDLRAEYDLGLALHVGKYGAPTETVAAMIEAARASDLLELRGLHFHAGRHSLDTEVWQELARRATTAGLKLCQTAGDWRPQELDLGGGIPSPWDVVNRGLAGQADRPKPAPARDYILAIGSGAAQAYQELGEDPSGVRLEIEPGRGLLADTAVHLARVRDVKRTAVSPAMTWVGTDTTVLNLHDSGGLHGRFPVLVVDRPQSSMETADIVGITCMVDRIVPDASIGEVHAGDTIAFPGAGAYQEPAASNFNALPRPGSLLVDGGQVHVIRRAESADDVFARDTVPVLAQAVGSEA